MAFWNRKLRIDEDALDLAAEQAVEQLRLGDILFQTLAPLAEQNTQVHGGKLKAGYLKQNAGKYSVVMTYYFPGHSESMLQFNIDLANDKLSSTIKYNAGPEFTVDQFDQFLEAASTIVRDFR